MIRGAQRYTRTDTLLPYTTLVRSSQDEALTGGRLVGRRHERQVIGELVRGAVGGRGGVLVVRGDAGVDKRSEEHTSELQSLVRISYAVFCLKQKIQLITASVLPPDTHSFIPTHFLHHY